jgi:hypothetical protein
MADEPRSSRERVQAHRKRLREQGLRPIQIWVPDVTTPEFAAEARRQSLAVATSAGEKEHMEFIELLFNELPWEDAMDWEDDPEST